MDGAGIMNLPTNVGGGNSQNGLDSYAPLIAAQQAARDIGYPRFTRELLAAGSEMDAAEVQEFLQSIRDAGLTAEDVALMRRVVEAVFNDPNNYPDVRERLLSEGVPDDLLPETFDIEFFTALRLAVEEAENLSREPSPSAQGAAPEGAPPEGMAIEGMAEGGIVGLPQLTPVARELASMGRNGDTMLAHITPQEATMLRRMGGSGSINPYTGLPEFFLKGLFKGISRGIKSIGRSLKKFAKSTVGRIVISVALGAFLGPAAAGFMGVSSAAGVAAVSGAIGGFGSSILAGDGLKNALRNGLTGAVVAGGMAGITGGSAAFQARPELQAAYQQQGFLGTVRQTAQNYFGSPVDTARQIYGTDSAQASQAQGAVPTAQELVQPPVPTAETIPVSPTTPTATQLPATQLPPPGSEYQVYSQGVGAAPTPAEIAMQNAQAQVSPPAAPQAGTTPTARGWRLGPSSFDLGQGLPPAPGYQPAPGQLPPYQMSEFDLGQGLPSAPGYQPAAGTSQLAEKGFGEKVYDFLSPSAREAAANQEAVNAYQRVLSETGNKALAEKAYTSALPGFGTKYGGIMLAGLPFLGSAFKTPSTGGMSQKELDARNQGIVSALRGSNPEYFGSFVPQYYTAADGSDQGGVRNFPRKNGHISGPGGPRDDKVPAMLSDGEFVFTAKAVRNMGGGSRRKGAAKMYKLMKMLEGGPIGKTAKA